MFHVKSERKLFVAFCPTIRFEQWRYFLSILTECLPSSENAESYVKPIKVAEIRNEITGYTKCRSSFLDGLIYEIFANS